MMDVKTIVKFQEESKKAKELCMDMFRQSIDIEDLDVEALNSFNLLMHMFDAALELTVEQAEAIYRIEKQLDRLVNKE